MPSFDWSSCPVLVTGGAGFIGSHLCAGLLARGAKVRVLDNFATGFRHNLAPFMADIELIEGDIRDPEVCKKAAQGTRFVFHQAALGSVPRSVDDPSTSIAINVTGTANVFAAARDAGVEQVVYASSSAVYGDSTRMPKREGEEGSPLSPYAVSKRLNEELADVYALCYGMKLIGLRYFNVYGPRPDPSGPYAAVVPRFFDAAGAGKAPVIYGDGLQSRDFTFVADVVEANLLAARAPLNSTAVCNIGAGSTTTVKQLAETICQIMGAKVGPIHEPERMGDVRHSQADASRAKQLFGFEAQVSLEEGLKRTRP
jgi:nucleoside-diphosphate-sugar epimerase